MGIPKELRDKWKRRGLKRLKRELEWLNGKIKVLTQLRDSLQKVIAKKEKLENETVRR